MATLDIDITVALRDFDLRLKLSAGRETVALVGPSGAGKTTALRAVAGLAHPHAGRIRAGDEVWFDAEEGIDLPPERRSTGFVFQDYALFPHMTVLANVAYSGAEDPDELLRRVGIEHLAQARPGEISGGERQRVALARALGRAPRVLLLDEPLAALDAQTRRVVRDELADALSALSIPALLVTHDFADAAALADRVAVLVAGRLRQDAAPQALIDAPADAAVARLTGANVLPGHAFPDSGGSRVQLDSGQVIETSTTLAGRVGVVVHPWALEVLDDAPEASGSADASSGEAHAGSGQARAGSGDGSGLVRGTLTACTLDGGRMRLRVGDLIAECSREQAEQMQLEPGAAVVLGLPRSAPVVDLGEG